MKRFLSCFLITVMMLGVLAGCETTPKREEYTFPDAEYDVNATDLAVVGDKIYYIREEKVYETSSDVVVFEEFPVQYISSNGKALAVYGNGQVWCDGKTYQLPQTEIGSFVYADGTFCWSYMQGELPQIGFYNTRNGDSITIAPMTGVACSVLPFHDDSILICCYEVSGEMYSYEFDTASMKPGKFMTEDTFSLSAAADEDTLVLIRSTGRVDIQKLSEQAGERRNPCKELNGDTQKLDFSGESAIFLSDTGTIYVRKDYCTPIASGNTVVILQEKDNAYFGEITLQRVNEALSESGLEVVVSEYGADQIKLKQLAGDDDYDLYVTDGYSIVLDYPIYEPLNTYHAITDQFDLMYDEIRDICTFNGNIYGVLVNLQVQNSLWGYNAELLDELEMSLPDASWTLEDYYKMAADIRSKGHYISKFTPLSLSDYIHVFGDMYETQSLTDDGTMLRKYLEIMKKLQKEGLLYSKETAEEGAKTLFGGSCAPFAEKYNQETGANEIVLLDTWYPVTFDGTMPDLTVMDFLQMNKNSVNKQNAALVMAEFMKPEYIENRGTVYYRETGDTIRSISEKAEECFQIYLNVLANSRPRYSHDSETLRFMNAEAEKYYNDEQDLDYTVEKILARARMIFEE